MTSNGTTNNGNSMISNGNGKHPLKEKILLVDDDPAILRMLGMLLRHEGYQVQTANDGHEALEKAVAFRPDLIVLDIMMPDINGFDICQRLRGNPQTKHASILMLSARTSEVDKATAFQMGADDYLEKPVGAKALLSRVEGLLLRARYKPQQAGSIVAVLGAKGGVGVTSLALNLGAALAEQHKNVVVTEMKAAGGTLHHFLHLKATRHIGSLLSLEPQQINVAEIERRLERHALGFQLLLAPPGNYTLALTADHVEAIVSNLTLKNDYVLVDLPTPPLPNIGPVLEQADQIILVTEPEPISLASTANTLRMLDEWDVINQVHVVAVTRSPAAALIRKRDMEEQLGVPVIFTIPPATEMFQDAARVGKPILELKPQSLPAETYRNLANWLLEEYEIASPSVSPSISAAAVPAL
jgi:pilus assembly protein CpaE